MRIFCYLLLVLIAFPLFAQHNTNYEDENGDIHLCGTFDISSLETIPTYKQWFNKNYNHFELPEDENIYWKSNLENYTVEIYMGTWCEDSKYWVPKFIKLWDDLKLKRDQLKCIGLYNTEDKYKIGPNAEEKGKLIHRVPTFIFKTKNGEQARIVESPVNTLLTDVAQIALGYPSKPNYHAANYAMEQFESSSVEKLNKNYNTLLKTLQNLTKESNTLNTLGYLFLKRKAYDKALLIFKLNSELFKYDPNVYDSYGEALAKSGKPKKAIKQYKNVLKLDPFNTHAKKQIKQLKE